MDKSRSAEHQSETRDIRPLDDTVEGEAVIPELDGEEIRNRTGGGGIRPVDQGQDADDLMKDEDDTDGNV